MLVSDQAYKVRKDRSDRSTNTRKDFTALKEATTARHATNVEGDLALFEEANVEL